MKKDTIKKDLETIQLSIFVFQSHFESAVQIRMLRLKW